MQAFNFRDFVGYLGNAYMLQGALVTLELTVATVAGGMVVGSSVNSVVVSLADSSDPPHAVASSPNTAIPTTSRRFMLAIMVQCCRRDGDLPVRSSRRSSLA